MAVDFRDLDEDDPASPAAPTNQTGALKAGDTFDGRFRLSSILGRGGAGTVWDARVVETEQIVALKIVPIPSRIRALRARREISIGFEVEGPHFVKVFDAGVVPPFAYVSMEKLDGEDLATRLDRVGKLSIDETLHIGRQLSVGLVAAHRVGLVHRDLKPTNVFLADTAAGQIVKILDFGVAKRLGVDSRVTASDTLLGAPQYAAPEQIQDARKVDTRADLWSMGAMLYRCLLGRRPFDGVGGALLATVLATPHPPPTRIDKSIPPAVDTFFEVALAKRPGDRFSDATQLIDAFARALDR